MQRPAREKPPYIGALLRLGVMIARDRLLSGLLRSGYVDLTASHLPVFSYPFPKGLRPIELAVRTSQSKQSMNNILRDLERGGYLKRKASRSGGRRLVFLTRKGMKVVEVCQREMLTLQTELAQRVGRERFDVFLQVLREFATDADPAAKAKAASARLKPVFHGAGDGLHRATAQYRTD